jgi:hypothetical protein
MREDFTLLIYEIIIMFVSFFFIYKVNNRINNKTNTIKVLFGILIFGSLCITIYLLKEVSIYFD